MTTPQATKKPFGSLSPAEEAEKQEDTTSEVKVLDPMEMVQKILSCKDLKELAEINQEQFENYAIPTREKLRGSYQKVKEFLSKKAVLAGTTVSPDKVTPTPITAPKKVEVNIPHDYPDCFIHLTWQDGPRKQSGVNGCQVVDLLRIAIVKLAEYQSGPCSCPETAKIISYVTNAIQWDERRTSLREAQMVEGSTQPHRSTT